MKKLQGKLTISRPSYRDKQKAIRITVHDDTSSCRAVEVELSLEDFAECLTGLGRVDCSYEYNDSGVIGKYLETKTEIVPHPKFNRDDTDAITRHLAPFHIDGWVARTEDLFNHHRHQKAGMTVAFSRFVDEKPEESE